MIRFCVLFSGMGDNRIFVRDAALQPRLIVAFGLAFYWRKRPEFHRRLMLMATCVLTAAAFGRFPHSLVPEDWFYAGADLLLLLGVVRDLIVTKRVHIVYLYGLPLLMLGQIATIYTYVNSLPEWLKIAHALVE